MTAEPLSSDSESEIEEELGSGRPRRTRRAPAYLDDFWVGQMGPPIWERPRRRGKPRTTGMRPQERVSTVVSRSNSRIHGQTPSMRTLLAMRQPRQPWQRKREAKIPKASDLVVGSLANNIGKRFPTSQLAAKMGFPQPGHLEQADAARKRNAHARGADPRKVNKYSTPMPHPVIPSLLLTPATTQESALGFHQQPHPKPFKNPNHFNTLQLLNMENMDLSNTTLDLNQEEEPMVIEESPAASFAEVSSAEEGELLDSSSASDSSDSSACLNSSVISSISSAGSEGTLVGSASSDVSGTDSSPEREGPYTPAAASQESLSVVKVEAARLGLTTPTLAPGLPTSLGDASPTLSNLSAAAAEALVARGIKPAELVGPLQAGRSVSPMEEDPATGPQPSPEASAVDRTMWVASGTDKLIRSLLVKPGLLKPSECPVCGMGVGKSKPDRLAIHVRSHYLLTVCACGRDAFSRDNLLKHIRMSRPGPHGKHLCVARPAYTVDGCSYGKFLRETGVPASASFPALRPLDKTLEASAFARVAARKPTLQSAKPRLVKPAPQTDKLDVVAPTSPKRGEQPDSRPGPCASSGPQDEPQAPASTERAARPPPEPKLLVLAGKLREPTPVRQRVPPPEAPSTVSLPHGKRARPCKAKRQRVAQRKDATTTPTADTTPVTADTHWAATDVRNPSYVSVLKAPPPQPKGKQRRPRLPVNKAHLPHSRKHTPKATPPIRSSRPAPPGMTPLPLPSATSSRPAPPSKTPLPPSSATSSRPAPTPTARTSTPEPAPTTSAAPSASPEDEYLRVPRSALLAMEMRVLSIRHALTMRTPARDLDDLLDVVQSHLRALSRVPRRPE